MCGRGCFANTNNLWHSWWGSGIMQPLLFMIYIWRHKLNTPRAVFVFLESCVGTALRSEIRFQPASQPANQPSRPNQPTSQPRSAEPASQPARLRRKRGAFKREIRFKRKRIVFQTKERGFPNQREVVCSNERQASNERGKFFKRKRGLKRKRGVFKRKTRFEGRGKVFQTHENIQMKRKAKTKKKWFKRKVRFKRKRSVFKRRRRFKRKRGVFQTFLFFPPRATGFQPSHWRKLR